MRLGAILKAKGLLTGTKLVRALDRQKLQGGKLGQILVEQGLVREEDLLIALQNHFQVPIIDLTRAPRNPEALRLLPQAFAIASLTLPITFISVPEGGVLVVAMEDPGNHEIIAQIHQKTGYPIKPMLAGKQALTQAIASAYHALSAQRVGFI